MNSEGTIRVSKKPHQVVYWERHQRNEAAAPATPMIFLHGNGGALLGGHDFAEFGADQDMIFIHRRGIGKAAQPFEPGTPDDFLAAKQLSDMDKVTAALGIRKSKKDYFGWSAGATLALLAAQQHPQQTRRIWLYGPWLSSERELRSLFSRRAAQNPDGWEQFLKFCGIDEALDLAASSDQQVRSLFNGYAKCAERDLDGAILAYTSLIDENNTDLTTLAAEVAAMNAETKREWDATIQAMGQFLGLTQGQLQDNMKHIRSHEIIVLIGEHDPLVDRASVRDFFNQAGCENVRIETVPDCGHDPHEPDAQLHLRRLAAQLD